MPVLASNIVATSQPLAAQAGLRMLLKGGNAVDAALAAAITLPVVEPTSNGIGSDAFALVWDGGKLHGLNASGRSPAAWTPERFAAASAMPNRGWDAITVPGCVSAWRALSEKFGKLPFADLFEPAIQYAHDGFLVSPTIARLWARQAPELEDQPGFRQAFLPKGRAPAAGELFRHPEQARTLRLIAQTCGESFYRGELAERMIAHCREHGGAMTLEDLARHSLDWVEPIHIDYRGYRIHEIPPNGQGIACLMALGMLEQFDMASLAPESAHSLHLQIEAMKLAFADAHEHIADAASMRVRTGALLDKSYLKERAKLIDPAKAADPGFGTPRGGTVYLTSADASGMMVSYIQSNFQGFGSGVVVPGTGISMQNRGIGFVLTPGHVNQVGPGKRPFHTIIPGFMTRAGQAVMGFGVMGGFMQAQGHTQMALRLVDHAQNPQAMIDAPRWRVETGPSVNIEEAMPAASVQELRERGHVITVADRFNTDFGRAQIILKTEGGYIGASEWRTDGQAVGF
ncbi:MAG: gamma-glutamyltransferase family protein [Burkholderiales bacterium]|nr:gamma-glutamyltransferase family protein [Burkholderiales bacterium]